MHQFLHVYSLQHPLTADDFLKKIVFKHSKLVFKGHSSPDTASKVKCLSSIW